MSATSHRPASMPTGEIDRMRAVAIEHDPDTVAIFVLHGSEQRGLALSGWTSIEGDTALADALLLVLHSATAEEIDR